MMIHEAVSSRRHETSKRGREERTCGGEPKLLNLSLLKSLGFGSTVLKPNLNLLRAKKKIKQIGDVITTVNKVFCIDL